MHRIAALALLLSLPAAAQENPATIAQRAAAAYGDGRYEEAATLYRELRKLVPRSISTRIQLARSLARTGQNDEALMQLGEAVAFGVRFDPADAAWNALRTDARFTTLESRMRERTKPIVRSETAFLLEKDLIPENIAWDPKSGAFFVGSMYKAKIVKIAPDGKVTDFIPSRRDGLLGVLGMKINAAKRELWAVAGNYGDDPPMEVADPATRGHGGIWRFDLGSGRLIRKYTAAQPMLFNDLVLARNGDVYATAGPAGVWRLRAGAETIEPYFAQDGAFFNGIAITPDGKFLFAASHTGGVIRIDTRTKAATVIEVPAGVTLGGIDGLYFHERSLVGVQNGTDPSRVIRAWLDRKMKRVTRFAVLEQAHPLSDIPLTGTIVGNDLYYVARSQLEAFENGKIWPAERLKETVILKLPLGR